MADFYIFVTLDDVTQGILRKWGDMYFNLGKGFYELWVLLSVVVSFTGQKFKVTRCCLLISVNSSQTLNVSMTCSI